MYICTARLRINDLHFFVQLSADAVDFPKAREPPYEKIDNEGS